MKHWLPEPPALKRAVTLSAAITLVAVIAAHLGQPVDWGTAILYGAVLAISARWPIIMPGTGSRVTILGGLVTTAIWQQGLPTALVLILLEHFLFMITLYHHRRYWEWYRPVISLISVAAAFGLARLAVDGDTFALKVHVDTAAFSLVYGIWLIRTALWALVVPNESGRGRADRVMWNIVQSWWEPLACLSVQAIVELAGLLPYQLDSLVVVALVWVQFQFGTAFTTLNQDQAASNMLRLSRPQSPQQTETAYRVLRVAHAIARALPLSHTEIRLVGYAALLQDPFPEPDPNVPLWLLGPPSPEQKAQIQAHIDQAVLRIQTEGALREVRPILCHRFAAFDGTGYPQVRGDSIPMTAQVLNGANAIVSLVQGEYGTPLESPAQAVEWICKNASSRFSPAMLGAMAHAFIDRQDVKASAGDLSHLVQQLRGLVSEPERPTVAAAGFRRMLSQIRGQFGLAPELPREVQAVARMATLFASSTEARRTAQIAADAVGQLMGAKVAVSIFVEGRDDMRVRVSATHGFHHMDLVGKEINVLDGPVVRAVMDQVPVQVMDMREVTNPTVLKVAQLEGIWSALHVPLICRGRTLGFLSVGMPRHHWFTPREVDLIHLMAGQAATALDNARLMRELGDRLQHISNLMTLTDTLLDNLATAIVVTDSKGRSKLANAAWTERFGPLPEGSILSERLMQAFRVSGALAGDGLPESDLRWEDRILEVQSVPLRNSQGSLLGAICLARDVTDVRRMEEHVRQVEKLAAVGELAAGAAHEIRNPLTSIRGFMQLLQARDEGEDDEYFGIILQEIDRIDVIIRDLLKLARPELAPRVPTSLPALVDEVLMLQKAEFRECTVSVDRKIEPSLPLVPVDPKHFRQLMRNLIVNACQAMPSGGTLTISMYTSEVGEVVIEVADTGVGIPAENVQRIFLPFFTTKDEGTGLGLALCYNIVRAHNGRLDVDSKLGEGTTFTITLPVE